MSDRPIHVQVAEALGWTEVFCAAGLWLGTTPSPEAGDSDWTGYIVPDFDTDWSATGPLIEKYEVSLAEDGCGHTLDEKWHAEADYYQEDGSEEYGGHWDSVDARGSTPLLSVCHLILALAKAGKL